MAMTREQRTLTQSESTIAAQTPTTDATGTGVDLQGFESALIVVNVGAEGDTLSGSVYMEIEVEESADDSTYTDCADADIKGVSTETTNNTGTIALVNIAADAASVYSAAYVGDARYIRVIDNLTGTHTNGTPISVTVIKGHARNAPTTPTA